MIPRSDNPSFSEENMQKNTWISRLLAVNLLLTLLALALYGSQAARAGQLQAQTAPRTISYQGVLRDANGNLVDGSKNLTFGVYAAESGGAALWEEAHLGASVRAGVFSILLGQTTPLPETLFHSPDRWLQVSVDGAPLTPRQKFSSVPYALNADTLDGYDASQLMGAGSGLPAGGVVYFPLGSAPAGFTPKPNATAQDFGPWTPMSRPAFQAKWENSAACPVWTGSQLFCIADRYSGGDGLAGASYDPASDAWQALPTIGAPTWTTNYNFPAVAWAGNQLLVWATDTQQGGRYIPASGTWAPMSAVNAPSARQNSSVVWAGSKLFVWGGRTSGYPFTYFGDGYLYNPVGDAWTPISASGAPTPRTNALAVWTGSKVIVFGGEDNSSNLRNGALYDPASDSWSPISSLNAPAASASIDTGFGFFTWTGTEMAVRADGALYFYNPATNAWRRVALAGALMGLQGIQFYNNVIYSFDGRYDLVSDQWISTAGAVPAPAFSHPAPIWSGSDFLFVDPYTLTGDRHLFEIYVPYGKD